MALGETAPEHGDVTTEPAHGARDGDRGRAEFALRSDAPRAGGSWPVIPGHEIHAEIARGGMGVVYKARHVRLKRWVALKMVLSGAHASPEQLERFATESQAVARLQHSGIVQIFEVGEHEGLPYLSLEFVSSGSLAQRIEGKPQQPREAAQMVRELALAVCEAHKHQIIHRDLKPSNVLMTADGQPEVTDFGLAKQMDSNSDVTRTGAVMGTPSYMAPEQAWGKTHEIGPATGPIGAGIYANLAANPYLDGFLPTYTGPTSATETRYHVMASPASVGTTLFDAATVTFFGEREDIAMAFADGGTSVPQVAGATNTSVGSAQPLTLAPLNVPNTLLLGQNVGDTFQVTAADVVGAITLGANGQSNAKYYAIQATAGELLNFQTLSASLTRLAGNGVDTVLTVYESDGTTVVPYNGATAGAFSDDGFQDTDAVLYDVTMP